MRRRTFLSCCMLIWIFFVYAFLLAPIVVLVFASFDHAAFFRFPPKTYSLHWYEVAWASPEYRSSLVVSALLALLSGLISVILGSCAAFALVRYKIPASGAVTAILMSPLVLPLIIWAIPLLQIYSTIGISGTLLALILAHSVITLPFTVRIMLSTFMRLDPRIEAAAASLGAPPFTVARRITLPLALPGIVSSAAFSLLVSFNDVIVSSLIAGARWLTFPVRVYAQLRSDGIDPTTLAIGSLIIVAVLVITLVGEGLFKWSRQL